MKILSTTNLRRRLSDTIREVYEGNKSVVVGQHNKPRVILIKYPDVYRKEFSDIANMNAYSGAFDYLADEPDLYSRDDIKEFYA